MAEVPGSSNLEFSLTPPHREGGAQGYADYLRSKPTRFGGPEGAAAWLAQNTGITPVDAQTEFTQGVSEGFPSVDITVDPNAG